MSILRLRPSRFSETFQEGDWAYAFADRRVRYLGELITPQPIVSKYVEDAGLFFDLVPNELIDEGIDFKYRIAVFDSEQTIIYQEHIVMPNITEGEVEIFDLIAEPVDLDSCVQTPLIDNGE